MWPWEHALFAYIFYSVYVHLVYRSAPTDWSTVTLCVGSLLPDLVDKPLAWQFGLFETGWGVAHSAFVAIPASVMVYALARRRGVGAVGVAFGFGYLLHLAGDVLPSSLSRSQLYLAPILWPVSNPTTGGGGDHASFLGAVHSLLTVYAAELLALEVTLIVVLQIGSVVVGGVLWLYDGLPGLGLLSDLLRRVAGRLGPTGRSS